MATETTTFKPGDRVRVLIAWLRREGAWTIRYEPGREGVVESVLGDGEVRVRIGEGLAPVNVGFRPEWLAPAGKDGESDGEC